MSADSSEDSHATHLKDESSEITLELSKATHFDFCWSFRDSKKLNKDQIRLTGTEANALIDKLVKVTDGHREPYRPDDDSRVIYASENGAHHFFWPPEFPIVEDYVTEVSFVPIGQESSVKTLKQHGFVDAPRLAARFRPAKLC